MRVWLAAAWMLALALAGCTEDAPAATDEGPEPGVVTDPTDYSYLQNGTDGAGWHIHDYWRGQDTREVLDDQRSCSNCIYQGSESVRFATFRPDTDHVVPQGAAHVNVTADWTIGSGNHRAIGLWVKTANTSELAFVAELSPGQPVSLNSTNDDNDPPHHRLSLWEFSIGALQAEGEDNVQVSDFEASIQVTAHRGLPIPPYPPHPDLWNGATELTLVDEERSVQYDLDSELGYLACSGCLGSHAPDDGLIVPYDASTVEVVLESQDGSFPATLGLEYHGADAWTYSSVDPDDEEPLRVAWTLPVEGKADSPYAKQSLWNFQVTNSQDTPAELWSGTYHITVTALKR